MTLLVWPIALIASALGAFAFDNLDVYVNLIIHIRRNNILLQMNKTKRQQRDPNQTPNPLFVESKGPAVELRGTAMPLELPSCTKFEYCQQQPTPKKNEQETSHPKGTAESRVWGTETPEPIATKFCTSGAVQDLITPANF